MPRQEQASVSASAETNATGGWQDAWLSPGRFALLLGFCIVASFPEVIFGSQSFVVRDFGLFSYPVAYFHRESFWRGEFPLWNPLHNCGVPFLAQFNTMTLYPLTLIYLLLPLDWSLSFFCLVHLFIAGMGMYWLCQGWTGSRLAAAIAGVAFAFNGLSLNFLMWPSHLATYAWMPWVVWGVERGWQQGGRQLVWAALFGALQMLGGGPETIVMTWLILLAMWAGQWISNCGARWPMAGRFAFVVALVAGLAAAQLLPFLDLVAHAPRGAADAGTNWSLPALGWGNFFVPLFHLFLLRKGVYFQDKQSWTTSYYVAIGVTTLALMAAWRVRRKRVWLLVALAVLGVLLARGQDGWAFRVLHAVAPPVGFMRHPIKFILLTVFAIPPLAAFGVAELDRLAAASEPKARRLILAFGVGVTVLIGGLIILARIHPADQEVWAVTAENGLSRFALLVLTLGTLVALWRLSGGRARPFLGVCLVALVWADAITHVPSQNPTARRTVFQPGLVKLTPQPAHGSSRAMVSFSAMDQMLHGTTGNVESDFLLFREGLFLDSNLLDDIPTIGGFYSLYLKTDLPIRAILGRPEDRAHNPLAEFVGISWENSPDDMFKFVPRTNYLPLVTGGQKPVFADPTNTLLELEKTTFDPRLVVYLPLEARGSVTASNQTEVHILSQKITAQRLDLEVEAREPALVVAAQTYYHPWRAWVNGKETEIYCANYGFQAWEVPAGRSQVHLEYVDGWFHAGGALCGLSLLVCLGMWRFAPRKPKDGGDEHGGQ